MDSRFEYYIEEAIGWDLSGWDFQILKDRWIEESPTWNYKQLVSARFPNAQTLLDMGTGGGELLSSFEGLPQAVSATESYKLNVPVAKARLEPLGINVIEFELDSELPFESEQFDLVINKHESFDAAEVFRILKPGGLFLTQQVGGKDNIRLNQLLSDEVENSFHNWCLSSATDKLVSNGFELLSELEEYPNTIFTDIGAVVIFLRAIPWQIPDFSVDKYQVNLINLHKTIQSEGNLVVNSHRFFIEVKKPT